MYISLQFKLQLEHDNKKKLLELMRKQSSAIRSAYNMLKDKIPQNQIYENLRQIFSDLPTKYIDSAIYKAKQYPTDKRVVFGGKALFENLKLLSDREYLEYALYCYEEKERELKENLKKETNQYKQNAIKSELKKVQKEKSLLLARLQSLQSEPSSCKSANGRNPKQGEVGRTTHSLTSYFLTSSQSA